MAPGPDKYKKFVNALRRLIVYLNDEIRNRLTKYLDKEYIPYYRQGINIRITKKIFKSIEIMENYLKKMFILLSCNLKSCPQFVDN